ncbi:MAG: AsmA family protein, partial [Nitrospiraceae bacterium]
MSHPVQSESSTNTRTWIVSLMVVCLIGIPLLTLPFLFKIDSLSAMVLDQVEQRIGHTIEVGSMRVTVLPRIGVELTNVRMLDSSTTARIFSARRMELVLQALPLLRGQIVGKRLMIERPHLEFHRDEAGQWSLAPAARRPPPTQAQTENPLALFAVVRNVLLTDGRITLTDHSTPSLRNVQLVTALQAIVSEGLPGRTATVQMQGEISGEPKTAVFSMEGTLLQTRSTAPDEKTAASPYPLQFDGTVRVDRLDVRQVADWLGRGSALDGAHGSARFSGRVRLVPRSNGYDLIVPEWTADVRDVSLRGEARVAGLHTATTGFSATLSSSSLDLQRWLDHIPDQWKPARIQTTLAEREIDGFLAIRSATLSGTLNSESPLDVAVEIDVRDGRILPAPRHPPLQRVSATVVYARHELRVIDLQGDYGPIRLSRGEILITNVETDPMADARISGTVQADGMIGLAKALNAPYIESFPTGFEQAQGQIAVAVHLAGRPMTGERLNLLEADVTIHDVGFRNPTLPVPIHKINGRVSFSPGIVRIDTLNGRVGSAEVEAQGSVTITDGAAYHDLRIGITGDAGDLAPLLPANTAASRPELSGPIHLAATVSGPLQTPRIKGAMDLQETALGIPNIITKPGGAPASIEFDGAVSTGRVLLVRRLDLLMPPIRLTGEGHVGLSDGWDFEARVVAKPVSLEKLPKGISVGAVKAGILQAALTMKGRATDRTSWETSGRIR